MNGNQIRIREDNGRRKLLLLLAFALTILLLISIAVSAAAVSWDFDSETGTLTITGTGAVPEYDWASSRVSWYSTAPWSPYETEVKSLVIGEGITSISSQMAFYYMPNLKEISLPSTLKYYRNPIHSSISKIYWHGTLDQWMSVSFYSGTGTEHISLNTILYMADGQPLTEVRLTAASPNVSPKVFRGIVNEMTLIVEKGYSRKIGEQAFARCSGLHSITFLGEPSEIAYNAFSDVTADVAYTPSYTWENRILNYGGTLTWIPSAMPKTGECGETVTWKLYPEGTLAVTGTGAMTDWNVSIDQIWRPYYQEIKKVIVADGVTHIGNDAFAYLPNLESIVISNSVTSIGTWAFEYSRNLTSVSLPPYLEILGRSCMRGLAVERIVIPATVTRIEDYTFNDNPQLTSVRFHDSLTYISATCLAFGSPNTTAEVPCGSYALEWAQEQMDAGNIHAYTIYNHLDPAVTVAAAAPTCTEEGCTEGIVCNTCGTVLATSEILEPIGHDWGEISYVWAEDNSTVTACRICRHDETHIETETANVTSVVTRQPTCEEKGETTYTSDAYPNEAFEAQEKVLEDIDPTGHTPLTVIEEIPVTCTETGLTATIMCEVCEKILQESEEVPALGHDWNTPVFTWADDHSACTASSVCSRCRLAGSREAEITLETTEPTCTEAGQNAYTATVLFDSQTFRDLQTVVLPVAGHQYGEPIFVWNEGKTACDVNFTCVHEDDEQTVAAEINSVVETEPTDTEMGSTRYTASAVFDEETYTDTQVVTDIPAKWSYSDDGTTVTAYNGTSAEAVVPEGITALDSTIFKNNTRITSIRIPASVETLSGQQFFGATSLEHVWLPDNIADISALTFYNVKAAFHVSAGSTTAKALSYRQKSFVLEDSGWSVQYRITSMTGEPTAIRLVSVPDGWETFIAIPGEILGLPVIQIMAGAFSTQTQLTLAEIPDSVTSIDAGAFNEGVTLSSSCEAYARSFAEANGYPWTHNMQNAEPLEAVEETCTETGRTEGLRCSVCGEVISGGEEIPVRGHDLLHYDAKAPTCTEAGWDAYDTCNCCSYTTYRDIAATGHDWEDPTYEWTENNSFLTAARVCRNDSTHTETETVEVTIEIVPPTENTEGTAVYTPGGFKNEAFTARTMERTIKALQDMAVFRLPETLEVIEEEAFEGLAFEAVIIPDSCTSIGRRAFRNCRNLVYVRIPARLAIPDDAFEECGEIIIDRTGEQ